MKIGDRIRDCRIKLGYSQDELAKKLGYKSRSSINKIERDASGLPQTKIAAIAAALNTTPGYIMGWEENPAPKRSVIAKAQAAITQTKISIPKKSAFHKVFSFGSGARRELDQFKLAYVGLTKNGTARVALANEDPACRVKIVQNDSRPIQEFEAELMRVYASLDIKGKNALLTRAYELASQSNAQTEKPTA